MRCRLWVGLLGAICAVARPISAEIIFKDSFSYPDGAIVLVSQGRWKTHSGRSEQVKVLSGKVQLSQSNTEDVSAVFLEQGVISATNCAVLYAAIRVRFSQLPSGVSGGYFAHFKDASPTTGFRCRIFATTNSAAAGFFRFGVAAAEATPSALSPDDLSLHTDYALVCRLSLSDSNSALWINPQSETDPCLVSADVAVGKSVAGFAFRESLASGSGMGELAVDELVVATSFEDLVPPRPLPRVSLRIARVGPATIELKWVADPSQGYSVWGGGSPAAEFYLLATGLSFWDGQGEFSEDLQTDSLRVYRVSLP